MESDVSLLDHVRIASPCPVSWSDMTGDDRVRYCQHCKLNVYNLSAMSRPEAESLIRKAEGRMCATFFRRADGTILTDDCPIGLRAIRNRVRKIGAGIAAGIAFLIGATGLLGAASGRRANSLRDVQPFASVHNWLFPQAPQAMPAGGLTIPTPGRVIMGKIRMPPAAPAKPPRLTGEVVSLPVLQPKN